MTVFLLVLNSSSSVPTFSSQLPDTTDFFSYKIKAVSQPFKMYPFSPLLLYCTHIHHMIFFQNNAKHYHLYNKSLNLIYKLSFPASNKIGKRMI